MTVYFYKTGELNGSNYFKIRFRSNALLNVENNDKHCFIWSILAHLHPSNINHLKRVSNCKQYFNELNIQGFDFIIGFKCSDVHKFNELNKLSVKIFELKLCQDQNEWKKNLLPIEVSKNESSRIFDLLIYKNLYALNKKFNVFSGDHHKIFICRRCLSSYTSENMLMLHKQKCGDDNKYTTKTSSESIFIGKEHFLKNLLYFRIYADFQADKEKDNSSTENKTTNNCKQNPIINGYHIISELEDVLKSGYHKSRLGYNNVEWFVKKVIKVENKMAFFFKNIKRDIIMTQEDEKDYKKRTIFVDFVTKKLFLIKLEIIVI